MGAEARSYDANGNLGTVGGTARSYVYNNANRMSATLTNGTLQGTYTYNGFGEQVLRQTTATTRFVYDEAGQLLGQYDVNGAVLQQYVWLDGQPVGVILSTSQAANANARMKYVQSDMLGSPRAIIDPVRNLAIWRWDESSEGFGSSAPNTDPDGDGTQVVFDLRFPGQRYDAASGLYYNYLRDYESGTGRYTQSDPIGLAGGISTYSYVGGNSMTRTDRIGLVYGDGIIELEDVFFGPVAWAREQMGMDLAISETTTNILVGAGDGSLATLSFGFIEGEDLRNRLGIYNAIDPCSAEYKGGRIAGTALTLAVHAGGAIPKTLTHFTTEAGARGIAQSGLGASRVGLFGGGICFINWSLPAKSVRAS